MNVVDHLIEKHDVQRAKLLQRIRRVVRLMLRRPDVAMRPISPAEPSATPPIEQPVLPKAEGPTGQAAPDQPRVNRHDRRRLEKWARERRKHDVLVKPAVPQDIPLRKPRKPAEQQPKRPKPKLQPKIPVSRPAKGVARGQS